MTNVYASASTGSWAGNHLQPIEPFPVFLAQEEQSWKQNRGNSKLMNHILTHCGIVITRRNHQQQAKQQKQNTAKSSFTERAKPQSLLVKSQKTGSSYQIKSNQETKHIENNKQQKGR